ncbi:MAG: DinB family protein [Anaerolineales bacterium]|nr:DinB family protein [Anaerolineales bacterium]
MDTKATIKSQYYAALAMLEQAIEKCPAELWNHPEHKNRSWHIVFHALFYTCFYLSESADSYVPWEGERDEVRSLGMEEGGNIAAIEPYTKAEMLAFAQHAQAWSEKAVAALDLESESGFYWLPFNKLELQFYNIRHLQLHTGELCERLGTQAGIDIGWVGMKPKAEE